MNEGADPASPTEFEEVWRGLLLGTNPVFARNRGRLKHIPSAPRCKLCAAPFGGIGAPIMRMLGRARWSKNPKYCANCFHVIATMHGGAEIEASFLFADVRGSTSLAERVSPTEFRRQLDSFYDIAAQILVEHEGIVDKFVGDEVMGVFVPALAHEAHAAHAIAAGLALLEATGHADPGGPRLPIGVGVHTGVAFVGSVGEAPVTEMTALGDVVNTAARLASAAAAGEVLVTEASATAAGYATGNLERRALELKGKRDPTTVFVARVSPPGGAAA